MVPTFIESVNFSEIYEISENVKFFLHIVYILFYITCYLCADYIEKYISLKYGVLNVM